LLLACNAATMNTAPEHFPSLDPLDLPKRDEFFRWPALIIEELQALLAGRKLEWFQSIGEQIDKVLQSDVDGKPFDFDELSKQSQAHSTQQLPATLLQQYEPRSINVFASVEPAYKWDRFTVKSERWERYAVFAWQNIRQATNALGELDLLGPTDIGWFKLFYELAAGSTLDAQRATQIAQSLRIEHRNLSRRGKHAADELHKHDKSKRGDAIAMADLGRPPHGTPFPTQEAAAEYIYQSLTKKNGRDFYKYETVKKWLIKVKWKPLHAR